MKQLFYFGCWSKKRNGHFLYNSHGDRVRVDDVKIPGLNKSILNVLDGTLCPFDITEGKYNCVYIYPIIILSWWDYSGDNRGGSNSSLISYGYDSHEIIDVAYKLFPEQMNRQERPTLFLNSSSRIEGEKVDIKNGYATITPIKII